MSHDRRDAAKRLVDSKLRTQVRIFLVVFVIAVIVTVERVVTRGVNPLWAVAGLAAGIAIGIVLVRTRPMEWDEGDRQVVMSTTAIGVVMLVLYIVFAIVKSDLLSRWIDDTGVVEVISMAITGGVMFGRIGATFRSARGVLATAGLTAASD